MNDADLIERSFEYLLSSLRKDTTEEEKRRIELAFEFARDAHKGVRRKSGEPYIMHPLAVATIVAREIGLGTKSVIAALLHDVVEDTDSTVEDIAGLFGSHVASIVDGLTKIQDVMGGDTTRQAESFRKVLLTLADDVRVILIKIADRLHNMRTLASMPERKQIKIAGETLYIYAPLAHRMGLHAIKTELENLCLKYEHPEEYNVLGAKIAAYEKKYSGIHEDFILPIKKRMEREGYEFTITSRTKSVYSVWHKMQTKNISFDEIYDILAVRIVFEPKDEYSEKLQCWNIYSLITELYSPNPDRLRDWLSVPKATGYEALHLTVMSMAGLWIEVQIRSQRMDEIAERGLAAHWKYKTETDAVNEVDKWLAGIKEMLDKPDSNTLDFLDDFKLNLFAKEIRVFTPKGYMRTLPKGATALDFAYDIHTEIGDKCIGAKVNHKLVPMSYKLSSGDQVEILTSDKQKVQREWLDFVITAKAKSHINVYFKRYYREELRNGVCIFETILKESGLPSTSEPLKKVMAHYELTNKDDLYIGLSRKTIPEEDLKKVLKKTAIGKFVEYWKLQLFSKGSKAAKDSHVRSEEEEYSVALCCSPIVGDDVVAIKQSDGSVVVHKRTCPHAIRLMARFGDRIVPVKWVSKKLKSFEAIIRISGIDSVGVVREITEIISIEQKVSLRKIHFETKDGIFEGILNIYVHNTLDLNNIIAKIAALKGIENVMRVENMDE